MTTFSDIAAEIVTQLYVEDDKEHYIHIARELCTAFGYGPHDWEDLLVYIIRGYSDGNYKYDHKAITVIQNELNRLRNEIYVTP